MINPEMVEIKKRTIYSIDREPVGLSISAPKDAPYAQNPIAISTKTGRAIPIGPRPKYTFNKGLIPSPSMNTKKSMSTKASATRAAPRASIRRNLLDAGSPCLTQRARKIVTVQMIKIKGPETIAFCPLLETMVAKMTHTHIKEVSMMAGRFREDMLSIFRVVFVTLNISPTRFF
jgi:hypothetical protein